MQQSLLYTNIHKPHKYSSFISYRFRPKRLSDDPKVIFLLISWDGVRLSLLGISDTMWPIVPAADERWWWWWVWSVRWKDNWQGKPKYLEKTSGATLSTTNLTWSHLGSNPRRRGGKPATSRLDCNTAMTLKCQAPKPSNEQDPEPLTVNFNPHYLFLLHSI
jgi:hypothetical protein